MTFTGPVGGGWGSMIPEEQRLGRVPPAMPAAPKPVADAIAEYYRLVEAATDARRQVDELADLFRQADTADLAAGVEALRNGKPDPGARERAKVEKVEAQRRRALSVATAAVIQAATDLITVVRQHESEWLTDLRDLIAERNNTMRSALDAWAEARQEREGIRAALRFAEAPHDGYAPGTALNGGVIGGEQASVVLQRLHADAQDDDTEDPK